MLRARHVRNNYALWVLHTVFTTKRLHRSNSSFNKTKRTKRGARPKTASVSRRRAKESGRKRRPQSAAAHLASTSNSSYILKNGAFLSSRSGISSLQDSSVMGRKELASTIPLPRPKSAVSRPRRRKVSGRPQSASVQRAARNGGRQWEIFCVFIFLESAALF